MRKGIATRPTAIERSASEHRESSRQERAEKTA